MNRVDKKQCKVSLLSMINEKKNILFGSFSSTLTKIDRENAWKEVHVRALSLQLITADKSWTFVRDNLFGTWKSRALVRDKII